MYKAVIRLPLPRPQRRAMVEQALQSMIDKALEERLGPALEQALAPLIEEMNRLQFSVNQHVACKRLRMEEQSMNAERLGQANGEIDEDGDGDDGSLRASRNCHD